MRPCYVCVCAALCGIIMPLSTKLRTTTNTHHIIFYFFFVHVLFMLMHERCVHEREREREALQPKKIEGDKATSTIAIVISHHIITPS